VKRLATPLTAAGLFLLNVFLNAPLFRAGELPFRGSIEGGYASMARFVSAHPDPWGWNPLQYAGLPTQFMYLPGLPYLTAALTHLSGAPPEYVYRLVTAVLACLAPTVLFLFAYYFTRSRWWALAAALGYTFFSPAYGLFPAVEKDRGIIHLPWHIQVLAKYGEGPHNAGLTMLPLAVLALWRASCSRRVRPILVAAIVLAAIPLTNWVSALALAIASLLFLLAALGQPDFRAERALVAAAVAYLLACFWLTPSFIQTVAFNWPSDSFGYRFHDPQKMLLAGVVGGVLWLRLLFFWKRGSFYFCFVTLCAFVFGWLATAFYVFGIDTIPESRRYALEFELFLTLAVAEALRLTIGHSNSTFRLCGYGAAGVMLLMGLPQAWAYVMQDRTAWSPAPREKTVEYRLADWIAQRRPAGRIFASGGLRFRLNSWFELPQVGGGFESGLRNRMPVDLAYRFRTGKKLGAGRQARDMQLILRALGVEYVVRHGPKSREYYRDYTNPQALEAVLPEVYRIEDDTVYAIPPDPLAHLVASAELPDEDAPNRPHILEAYVAAMDDAARPKLRTRWTDMRTLTVDGEVPAGRLVATRVSWDPGWRARQDGREVPLHRDNLGYAVVEAAAAPASHIELRFAGTAEQHAAAALSVLAWIGLLVVWLRDRD
jgi:hypothetical protein